MGGLRHNIFVRQIEPWLAGVAGDICAAGEGDQLVNKIFSAHGNQRANADQQKHRASGRRLDTLFHFRDLRVDFHDQPFPCGFISQQTGDGFHRIRNLVQIGRRDQDNLEAQAFQLFCLLQIGRPGDADHEVRSFGHDRLDVGADEVADFWDLQRLRRIITIVRNADQAVAQSKCKQSLGYARRKRDHAFGNFRFTGVGFDTEADKEEIHNEQCGEIVLEPIHLGASAKRKRTEASLNSPTAPNVSPVMPPNRR